MTNRLTAANLHLAVDDGLLRRLSSAWSSYPQLALMELLMSAPGRMFSRVQILSNVWGIDEDPLTNVVDVYIRRLRGKIDEPDAPSMIRTVRGLGYRLDVDQRSSP